MSIARLAAIVSLLVLASRAHPDEPGAIDATEGACDNLRRSVFYAEDQIWAPLDSFRQLESECEDTRFYYQHRAQLESFVGNHGEALRYWDKNYSGRSENQDSSAVQGGIGSGIKSESAVSHIVSRSSEHQMVIVNERHHVSSDRLLTLALLEPLSRRGFRYLAVEAVWPGDDINQRGYPTKNTGYYVSDVVFAEMLRAALSLGYEIVWYEIEEDQKNVPDSRTEQARRDYWQARNLVERTLVRDPEARVLVHCGWGHVSEQPAPGFQPMAHFVREITGIDPLSVDQTRLSEIGTDVDIRVLSPRTRYRNGRPVWMEMLGRRHPVTVHVRECSATTCVIEARNADQPDEIAYDRVEITDQDAVALYLPSDANVELFLFGIDGKLRKRRALPN